MAALLTFQDQRKDWNFQTWRNVLIIWTKNWWESASWEAQKRRTRRFFLSIKTQFKTLRGIFFQYIFNFTSLFQIAPGMPCWRLIPPWKRRTCGWPTVGPSVRRIQTKAEALRPSWRFVEPLKLGNLEKGPQTPTGPPVTYTVFNSPIHKNGRSGFFFFLGGGEGFAAKGWSNKILGEDGWGGSDTFCWLRVQKEIVWKVGVIWCNTFLRFFVEHRPCDPKSIPLVWCFLSAAAHWGCTLECSRSTFLRSGTDQYVQEAWARSANLSETIKGISLAGDHLISFLPMFFAILVSDSKRFTIHKTAHDTAVRPNTVKKKQLISDEKDVSMQLSNELQWKV